MRAALACALLLGACLSGACKSDDSTDGGGGLDHDAGSLAFADVYRDVLLKRCADAVCHGGGAGMLDMSSADKAYDALVGTAAAGPECKGMGLTRVVAGDVEKSLIYQKLTSSKVCGQRMPIGGGLEPDELARLEGWIASGATRD